jgi:23S rRNA (uracil1939-C5)-methyltransferase
MPPRNRNRKKKVTRKRQPLTGEVLSIELGQDGVRVRTGQGVLTLPAGVPGDQVRLVSDARRPPWAELQGLERPSPHRVPSPCPLLDRCGGCSLQAMDYPAQVQAKTEALRQAMASVGCPPERVGEVVGLERPLGHRTKLLMQASGSAGNLRFGFYRRGALEVVPAEGCPVQHPLSLATLATARQLLDDAGVAPSPPRGDGGWLHAVGIRVDPPSGEVELTLSGRSYPMQGGEALVKRLCRIPGVVSVHLATHPRRTSYPMEPPLKRLAGRRRMTFTLGGQRFKLSPETFFQTSSEGAELLLEQVRQLLPEAPIQSFADLYAGAGLLALLTRERWRRGVVVESNPAAVADLEHRLKRSASPGLSILAGKVERQIERVLRREPEVVLLDPPRRGCHPDVITALVRHRPPTVLLVGCGFEALMQHIERLVEGGYAVDALRAVEIFPHTAHLEVLVRFVVGSGG